MTKEQIALVQDTWRDVVLVADSASAMFYSRLFAIDPEAGARGMGRGLCHDLGAHAGFPIAAATSPSDPAR